MDEATITCFTYNIMMSTEIYCTIEKLKIYIEHNIKF